MSAWGHAIEPVAPDEPVMSLGVALLGATPRRVAEVHCSNGLRCPGVRDVPGPYRTYRVGGVPVTHRATYRYVSGRAGRVTYRELWLCEPCAEKFAAKWCSAAPSSAREIIR